MIADAKKSKKESNDSEYSKKVALRIAILKEMIKLNSKCCNVIISGLKMNVNQSKAIGKKLAGLAPDGNKKEEKTNESYQFDDNVDDFFSTSFC